MNTSKITALVICFFALLSLTSFISDKECLTKEDARKTDGQGFAVLELFTSEGCSSCPPADALMAKIQKESSGKSIYVIAFHVDYWDNLGWKDPFSDPEFSKRQVQYGQWLNVANVYTPQVIINGKSEFVGSNESAIRNSITKQLNASPVANLKIRGRLEGEKLTLEYQSEKSTKESILMVAVVQKFAETKVARGENAGRTLSHVQIVRQLQTIRIGAAGKGSSTILLPKTFDTKNWEVLGMLQDQKSGAILSVTRVGL
jgi:hypothetical protein